MDRHRANIRRRCGEKGGNAKCEKAGKSKKKIYAGLRTENMKLGPRTFICVETRGIKI